MQCVHQIDFKFNSVDTMTEIIACDVLISEWITITTMRNHGYSYEREDWQ